MEGKTKQSNGAWHTRHAMGRQIYACEVYPFSAPNGSRITVCGHDQGLLFIWRGGKIPTHDSTHSKEPSSTDQDVHMRDSEENGESDESQHITSIIQKLDLPLGTEVLHIAFPQLQQLSRPQEIPLAPKFLQRDLVVALACGDGGVRLLTLPLEPPSSTILENKKLQQDPLGGQAGKGVWGEKLVTIPNAHQSPARGVAVAFVARAITNSQAEDDNEDEHAIDVLLASHSVDLSGTLLIHRIPVIHRKERFGTPEIWRSVPLAAPAYNIDLFVSPNGNSSPKVLVSESTGVVRIFECVSAKTHAGHWSLSLYAPIIKVSENHTKSVTSVKWVLGGQAIAILTADGGWGVWDIGIGKSGKGLSGARPTPFTITGRVGTAVGGTIAPKSSNQKVDARSQLAPMTPGTRKIRQEALFLGKTESATKGGGISINHYSASVSTTETDESLLFWFGDSAVYLPSLRTHWQNKFSGANSVFTTSASGHIRDIPSISLGSEARISVSAISSDNTSTSISASGNPTILVAGERSLTFSSTHSTTRIQPTNVSSANQSRIADQSQLSRGLLDVNGLDRLLDGMPSRPSTVGTAGSGSSSFLGQKRVVFR